MIKAINKQGKVSQFTERVWGMMAKDKNGFKELVEGDVQINVPAEIKEFQAKVTESTKPEPTANVPLHPVDPFLIPATDQKATPGDSAAEMDIMKELLDSKKVKHHPNLGYDNLKKLYDAHK